MQENKPLSPLIQSVCWLLKSWLILCSPHGLQLAMLTLFSDLPGKNSGVGCISFSRKSAGYTASSTLPKLADTEVSLSCE